HHIVLCMLRGWQLRERSTLDTITFLASGCRKNRMIPGKLFIDRQHTGTERSTHHWSGCRDTFPANAIIHPVKYHRSDRRKPAKRIVHVFEGLDDIGIS